MDWTKTFSNKEITKEELKNGIPLFRLITGVNKHGDGRLFFTSSESRRAIQGGGIYLSDGYSGRKQIRQFDYLVTEKDYSDFWEGVLIVHSTKTALLIKVI